MLFSYDVNLEQIGAKHFCTACSLIYQFDLCYSCIGSLGISIFRILYIKQDEWLKYDFGEKKFMCITLLFGLSLTAIFVTCFNVHDYSQIQRENCLTQPQIRMLGVWLEEYKESQGGDSTTLFWIVIVQVIFLILIAMTLAEITTYCVYFHHIYQHDNNCLLYTSDAADE